MKTMKRPSAMVDGKAMTAMKASKPKGKAKPKPTQAMEAIKKKPAKQDNAKPPPVLIFHESFPIDSSLVDAPTVQQKELLRRVGIALSKYNATGYYKDATLDQAHLVGALLDSGITLSLDRFSFCA